MDDEFYLILAGELITPLLSIVLLALFIHCVLSLVRHRQRDATRADSLVIVV